MIKENLTAFLKEQMAERTRHSGRTLYDHLVGTHDLLQKWGANEDLCHAGLFHSIYGTRRFRHQSWPLMRRDTIAALIGDHAEFLVYVFCVIERPRALLEAPKQGHVFDTHGKRTLVLTQQNLRDLLELETANLLEQNGSQRWLARLLMTQDISQAAKKAISDQKVTNFLKAAYSPLQQAKR